MESQFVTPKVARPSQEEFIELAKDLGLHLNDSNLEIYRSQLCAWLESYDFALQTPHYLPQVKYQRSPGIFPSKSENKNNAWYVKTDIKGAQDGKLSGKTVVIKDNICVAGVQMMNGASHLQGYMPEIDATIVARLLDAGATIIGKSNCECLCLAGGSNTSFNGPVHNPFQFGFMSGGSSSGTCSIVGAGEADLGVGTDNGGSIRIPSSWCGCFGMKPTFGLVPMTGIMSFETTSDHCGPITRTCMDNAMMLEVMAGLDEDEMDPRQKVPDDFIPDYTSKIEEGVKGLKIGIWKEGFGNRKADKRVEDCVMKAAEKFKNLGAEVFNVSCPELFEATLSCDIILTEGFYQTMKQNGAQANSQELFLPSLMKAHSKWRDQADDLSETVKMTMLVSEFISRKYPEGGYGKIQNIARTSRKVFKERFKKKEFDLMVFPTVSFGPKPIPGPDCSLEEYLGCALGMGRNTGPFNITGNPVLTMPVGKVDGFPVGMSIVGAHFKESLVYRASYALEKCGKWSENIVNQFEQINSSNSSLITHSLKNLSIRIKQF